MNQQTIYFLQSLWEADVQKEKILYIAKQASKYELKELLQGILNPNCLLVSELAKDLVRQVLEAEKEIDKITRPYQLLRLEKEYKTLIGRIQALQIQTAQNLQSDSGMLYDDLHIIAEQMLPFAQEKIREQSYYQLYRYLLLTGKISDIMSQMPENSQMEEWIVYYRKMILSLFDQLNKKQLDGRWAYEKRQVTVLKGLKAEQFVAVVPEDEELQVILGRPRIGTGVSGRFRIHGRGYITNSSPLDLIYNNKIVDSIPRNKDFHGIQDANLNPVENLNLIFKKEKYVISAEEYFRMINSFILAETFYQRYNLQNCLICGSATFNGKCPKCGNVEIW